MNINVGDRIPFAMRALEKSTGKTSAELDKMMKEGKLTSEYIKPLIDEIGKLALANGAYEKALKKLGTVENQLKSSGGYAAARVAEAGFTEGLVKLYNELMNSMNNNGVSLDRLGKIYQKVFEGIAVVVKGATWFLEKFIRSVESVGMAIGWMVDNPIKSLLVALPLIISNMKTLGSVMMMAFRGPVAMLTLMVGLIDEVRGYFDENVDGLMDDQNWTDKQRQEEHAKRRLMFGIGREGDLALAGGSITGDNALTRFGSNLGKNMPLAEDRGGSYIIAALEGFAKTSYDLTTEAMKDFAKYYSENNLGSQIFNITISSPDPEQAGVAVRREFDNKLGLLMAPKK